MNQLPQPHLVKINAAILNEKLPVTEIPRLEAAIVKYNDWITAINEVDNNDPDLIEKLVTLFNGYKFYIDFDLIFSSPTDFYIDKKDN